MLPADGGDDGGQRQVVMNFIYTPRGHCLCKSSFYFFGRRRNTMRGPSSTAAHAAAHRGPFSSRLLLREQHVDERGHVGDVYCFILIHITCERIYLTVCE